MKLLEPRRKRRVTAVPRPPFPIQIESETGIPASRALWQVYTGIFNGDCVVIDDPEEMDIIFNMGFFGKGSLSRGGPEFGKVKKGLPPYLRNRQWLRRKEWAEEQEKIERAGNGECGAKDQMIVDGGETDDCAVAGSGNHAKELVTPDKSDVTVVAGPSSDKDQGVDNSEENESLQNDIITLEVLDDNNTKTDSKTGAVSNVAKVSLKDMDIVVLSDDDVPKRQTKCLKSREDIEVIDDNSSSDAGSKLDVHTRPCSNEGENKHCFNLAENKSNSFPECTPSKVSSKSVTSTENAVHHNTVDIRSPVHQLQGNKPVTDSAEVIEIMDVTMDMEAPAVASCSDSSGNKGEEVVCVASKSEGNKGGSCNVEVVMVQDNDSKSGADVVMVEDTDRSCGVGMAVAQEEDKDGDSESEGSDLEEQCKRTAGGSLDCKVLVLPDSDSEDEGYKNYMKNLRARLEWEQFPVRETLHLSLEEAYFLSYGLGCLQVLDPFGSVLSLVDLWKMFRDAHKGFVPKYVAYHYLRAKGWVVRSGLKYGGDFLLYKQGPVFYHASYVVIVEVLQAEDWSRHPTLNSRSFSWGSMTTLNRVVTAAGKELLICQVIWPTGIPSSGPDSPASFPQFAVNEVLMRRWVPSEEREKNEESVDWDGK